MDIIGLIKKRRTIRKFKNTQLDASRLYEYINAARLAPSACNFQPLKYAVLCGKEKTDKMFEYVRWAGYLAPFYNPEENERPTAYIVMCVDESISQKCYEFDAGAAAENIVISALADGIGSCIMGAIDREKIKAYLNLSENLKVLYVIALGYPSEEPEEVSVTGGDIKYYLNAENRLCVPKRSIKEVLIDI